MNQDNEEDWRPLFETGNRHWHRTDLEEFLKIPGTKVRMKLFAHKNGFKAFGVEPDGFEHDVPVKPVELCLQNRKLSLDRVILQDHTGKPMNAKVILGAWIHNPR